MDKYLWRRLGPIATIVAVLGCSASGGSGNGGSATRVVETTGGGATITVTRYSSQTVGILASGEETAVAASVPLDAQGCRLVLTERDGEGKMQTAGLPVAISGGQAHFRASRQRGAFPVAPAASIYCVTADGSTTESPIAFEVQEKVTAPAAPQVARWREPLEGDPQALSPIELATRGYPTRPGPNSPAYPYWQRAVTTRTPVLSPQTPIGAAASPLVPAVHHSLAGPGFGAPYSNTWAGVRMQSKTGAGQFGATTGYIEVPQINPSFNLISFPAVLGATASAYWTGIDGVGTDPNTDLIQAGVEGDWVGDIASGLNVLSYFTWAEYFPANSFELKDVTPGDFINTTVFPTDSNASAVNLTGGNAAFFLEDVGPMNIWSLGPMTTPAPSSATAVRGRFAEWIVERDAYDNGPLNIIPGITNGSQALTNFNNAFIYDPMVYCTNGDPTGATSIYIDPLDLRGFSTLVSMCDTTVSTSCPAGATTRAQAIINPIDNVGDDVVKFIWEHN